VSRLLSESTRSCKGRKGEKQKKMKHSTGGGRDLTFTKSRLQNDVKSWEEDKKGLQIELIHCLREHSFSLHKKTATPLPLGGGEKGDQRDTRRGVRETHQLDETITQGEHPPMGKRELEGSRNENRSIVQGAKQKPLHVNIRDHMFNPAGVLRSTRTTDSIRIRKRNSALCALLKP